MAARGKRRRNFTAAFRPGSIVKAADGSYNTDTADEDPVKQIAGILPLCPAGAAEGRRKRIA